MAAVDVTRHELAALEEENAQLRAQLIDARYALRTTVETLRLFQNLALLCNLNTGHIEAFFARYGDEP